MSSLPVAEDLDVLVDGCPRLGVRRPRAPIKGLVLQRAEEALDDSAVPAVAFRLVLQVMPLPRSAIWYPSLVYREPRSECESRPGPGRR